MFCTNCGKEARAGAAYCTQCGTKLREAEGIPIFCTNCGKEARAGAAYCTQCGTKLREADAEATDNAEPAISAISAINEELVEHKHTNFEKRSTEAEEWFCTGCNAPVTYKDKICPRCGADISAIEAESTLRESQNTPVPHKKRYMVFSMPLQQMNYEGDPPRAVRYLGFYIWVRLPLGIILALANFNTYPTGSRAFLVGQTAFALAVLIGLARRTRWG